MTPEYRARQDYREEGVGQDANPYDRDADPDNYHRYAWEMHKIWAEEFNAEIQLAKAEMKRQKEQRHGNTER